MNKLSRNAKRLDIVLRILFWLLIISTVVAAIAAAAPLVMRRPAPDSKPVSIDLDYIKLELAKPDQEAAMAQQKATLAATVLTILGSIVGAYCIKLVRNILKPIIQEQPFQASVALNLKKLGWVSLIGGVAMNGVKLLMENLIVRGFNLTEMLNSDIVTKTTFNYSINWTFLLVAAGLFLLSYIFRYGAELQQLSDETL